MASTTVLHHPLHRQHHRLEHLDFSKDSIHRYCVLCLVKISADGYTCWECDFFAHRACVEAPPRIDLHPLHTDHPLTLIHRPPPIINNCCNLCGINRGSSYRCDECHFSLDIRCALSTLSDLGGTQGKTPEQIKLPFHNHTLISFSIRHDFIEDNNCVICKASVEGDGYACLNLHCKFLIHKRCVQDLYYKDGTKAPQVYHGHPLETFLGEDTASSTCVNCESKKSSGEFIGCAECQGFYCRDCVQVPESIQYPHHPDHNLVLLINSTDNDKPRLCYGCPSCEFFADLECALQVLSYWEEGMSTEIELSWHEHPLLLCHKPEGCHCFCCEDKSAGPMYTCEEKGCEILLHKRCTEIKATIIHPHHPDHPLTLYNKGPFRICEACSEPIDYLKFSCELCAFNIHAKCAAHVPTRKHYLHEHELLHLNEAFYWDCNRCGTSISSPFFRCVPCNFNLHEECMTELPLQVVNNEVHWHPLTLHETYMEDDSGEYYCDRCEKRRDGRLGVYVCLQCSARWAYHVECIMPELRKIFEKKSKTPIIRRFNRKIARKEEEVRAAEVKLEGIKRELDQLMKKRDELISGEEHYETATDDSEQEESD